MKTHKEIHIDSNKAILSQFKPLSNPKATLLATTTLIALICALYWLKSVLLVQTSGYQSETHTNLVKYDVMERLVGLDGLTMVYDDDLIYQGNTFGVSWWPVLVEPSIFFHDGDGEESEGYDLARINKEYYCLLKAVYVEAYSEGQEGQQAVAQVIYNRYLSQDFPNDVCEVIYQDGQFQWTKSYKDKVVLDDKIIEELDQKVASVFLGVYTVPKLEDAIYFKRCDSAKGSKFWKSRKMVRRVGNHCFYK